jgi:hypothetical protein
MERVSEDRDTLLDPKAQEAHLLRVTWISSRYHLPVEEESRSMSCRAKLKS